MATDPRKRQKKLERRTAKRKEKKHQLVKKQEAGLAERLTTAAKYPVLHSRVSETFWDQGIGPVLLSRQLPDGSVAAGVFLVDRYCLGVKDAFANIVGGFTYESEFLRKMGEKYDWRDVSPATARKLVEGAVAYAAGFGLSPHPDYHKVKPIFGGIDAGESTEPVEFGKDGKPFFVSGPNETPERCRQILALLTHSCGPDGFHYMMPIFGDSDRILPDALKHERARLTGPVDADWLGEDDDREDPPDGPQPRPEVGPIG
jgi:hypothetical protein